VTKLYLLIAILAEVIATSALKASNGFTKIGPSCIVLVGYVIAFYCLSLSLKTIPVGLAYAIWSGLGIVLITVVGVFFINKLRISLPLSALPSSLRAYLF
jgi:small multidrug resistance pump